MIRSVPRLLLFSSLMALVTAYIAEYVFGLRPCILCLYQRIPYAIVITATLCHMALPLYLKEKWVIYGCLITLIAGTSVAGFHVGVEQHWWQGTESCGSTFSADSIDALRAMLQQSPAARCDEPAFTFLGISMTGWNMLYSLALVMLCIYWIQQRRKHGNTA